LAAKPYCGRLVDDDDDVRPVGQERELHLAVARPELLDGGEDHPADLAVGELGVEVVDVLDLDRRLAESRGAPGEGGEELVVEVIAVSQDDERRILQRRLAGVSRRGLWRRRL
jgi:hypothetical protein